MGSFFGIPFETILRDMTLETLKKDPRVLTPPTCRLKTSLGQCSFKLQLSLRGTTIGLGRHGRSMVTFPEPMNQGNQGSLAVISVLCILTLPQLADLATPIN